MVLIDSGARLAECLATDRAVVFIHFEWSGQSAASLNTFKILEELFCSEAGITFWRLDPDGHEELWPWLGDPKRKKYQELTAGGFGSIVWLRSGEIMEFDSYAAKAGVENPIEKTRSAFRIEV